jgi:anti-sigma factor ChrR (cupin superfamily)
MNGENEKSCPKLELVHALALGALSATEAADVRLHEQTCETCRAELEALRPVVAAFVDWPTDVLRPSPLWHRLAERIASDPNKRPGPSSHRTPSRTFAWNEVAPGIFCKLLATDEANKRVSMLVRLAPGVEYPPHRHAGLEELHLLSGELFIDDRKLYPGDYNVAQPGTADARVWSETGCTCVLMTSIEDEFR